MRALAIVLCLLATPALADVSGVASVNRAKKHGTKSGSGAPLRRGFFAVSRPT